MTTDEKLDLIIRKQQTDDHLLRENNSLLRENNLWLQAIGKFIYDNRRSESKDFSMDLIANLLAGNILFKQGR